jgi:hypothetical protein
MSFDPSMDEYLDECRQRLDDAMTRRESDPAEPTKPPRAPKLSAADAPHRQRIIDALSKAPGGLTPSALAASCDCATDNTSHKSARSALLAQEIIQREGAHGLGGRYVLA